jgi:hypothetical protein
VGRGSARTEPSRVTCHMTLPATFLVIVLDRPGKASRVSCHMTSAFTPQKCLRTQPRVSTLGTDHQERCTLKRRQIEHINQSGFRARRKSSGTSRPIERGSEELRLEACRGKCQCQRGRPAFLNRARFSLSSSPMCDICRRSRRKFVPKGLLRRHAKFPAGTDTASLLKYRKMGGARIKRKRPVNFGDLGFGQV